VAPHHVSKRLSQHIDVKLGLKEKFKVGGYRCISFKAMDTKGGEFVENPACSLMVIEKRFMQPVAEIARGSQPHFGPEGCYKHIEIGVNNYDPTSFKKQSFTMLFLKDSKDYSEYQPYKSIIGNFEPIHEIKSEMDILSERIEADLIAQGEFTADDLIDHSMRSQDFLSLEPQGEGVTFETRLLAEREEEDESEYRMPLFTKDKSKQIGLVTLKHIACKRRTSFLDLVTHGEIEIVPFVAIDFSLSNVVFDERKCLHSVKEDIRSEYRNLLVCVSKAFRQISPSSLFYGFGAKTVPKTSGVSHLFAATGDLINPIVMTDHIEQAYY